MAEPALDPNAKGNLIDENLVRDYLGESEESLKKIASIQMMGAEAYKARKYNKNILNASAYMFRMLTDKSLGESWKSIIKAFVEKSLEKLEKERADALA